MTGSLERRREVSSRAQTSSSAKPLSLVIDVLTSVVDTRVQTNDDLLADNSLVKGSRQDKAVGERGELNRIAPWLARAHVALLDTPRYTVCARASRLETLHQDTDSP